MDERPTSSVEKSSLEYEQRIAFVSRKQYRRLMALTLLNTILLAGFIVGPSVGPMVKSQWQQFQARREARRVSAQRQAVIAAAKAFTQPPDRVVYEERPDEAAKLLAADPTRYLVIRAASGTYFTPRPWQAPVRLKTTAPAGWSSSTDRPLVFLHAMRNGRTGEERLVEVQLDAAQSMQPTIDGSDQRRIYTVDTDRQLVARVVEGASSAIKLDRNVEGTKITWTRGQDNWEGGQVEFEPHGLFRIYAGQVDPGDPAHFTIDYERDGRRGTIDGYVREGDYDRIEFVPRSGAIVSRDAHGRQTVWDPDASLPATRP